MGRQYILRRTAILAAITHCLLLLIGGPPLHAQADRKPGANARRDRVFRAGAATSNITPPLGQPLAGGWSAPRATHVHDELHARCLVLDDGQTRLAFAICDNLGIPREVFDAARKKVHEETGLPESHVLLAATHTHSATTARRQTTAKPARELANKPQI